MAAMDAAPGYRVVEAWWKWKRLPMFWQPFFDLGRVSWLRLAVSAAAMTAATAVESTSTAANAAAVKASARGTASESAPAAD
jgi:hypothetical protein